MERTTIAIALAATLGASVIEPAAAVGLADGFYDMVINNTPYVTGSGYSFGSDGAWNSSFSFGSLPGVSSSSFYDDTVAAPVNGKYSGVINDGVAGTIGIQVSGGVITGTGKLEIYTLDGTPFGSFVEYGGSSAFTGSIDTSGNISLTPTGLLGTPSAYPSLIDKHWNIDDWDSGSSNGNTAYDAFSTGTASNASGTIQGAAYNGTTAILVKGGHIGSEYSCCFGATYFEVWNVAFIPTAVPIPAAFWLFGSGLIGLLGIKKRQRPQQSERI